MKQNISYTVIEVKPCADVDGYSVKGSVLGTTFENLYKSLKKYSEDVKLIKSAKTAICKIESCDFYLYEDNSFVILGVSSEEIADVLMKKILEL